MINNIFNIVSPNKAILIFLKNYMHNDNANMTIPVMLERERPISYNIPIGTSQML